MSKPRIIDFLSNPGLDRDDDVWGEAGRAIEVGNRASPSINLPIRLAITVALTLPLLSRLMDGGVPMLLRSLVQPMLDGS